MNSRYMTEAQLTDSRLHIGLVCPYSLDIPGGVQHHILDLAETLISQGHSVSILAPTTSNSSLPSYVVPAGRAVALRYNGSVARVSLGMHSFSRVRRWLHANNFDVLHIHEPGAPSVSLLTCVVAPRDLPIVATFHTSTARSKALAAAGGILQPFMEKITGRIAVSALARKVQVEHLAAGAVEIPNGVRVNRYRQAEPYEWAGPGCTIGFLGRFSEPRKGFSLILSAFTALADIYPDLKLVVAGPGSPELIERKIPVEMRSRVRLMGMLSEHEKMRMLRSLDIYVAPNTGGESFGMILTEAMAAGAAVVASDLEAFKRVLDQGRAGQLFSVGDVDALIHALKLLIDDPQRRKMMVEHANHVVAAYDWTKVAGDILTVYRAAIAACPLDS